MFNNENPFMRAGLHRITHRWAVNAQLEKELAAGGLDALHDRFLPTTGQSGAEATGISFLATHIEGLPKRGMVADGAARLEATLWVMVHDAEKLSELASPQSDVIRHGNDGYIRLAAAAHGMNIADHFPLDRPGLNGLVPLTAVNEDYEDPVAALPEGAFRMRVTMGVDQKYWAEETGERFSLDSFRAHMMPPAFTNPHHLGIELDGVSLTHQKGSEWAVDLTGRVLDGVAAGVSVATLMRESGYGSADCPPDPGEALAEIWMMSNDAPSPDTMGIEYRRHSYTAGADMTAAREIRHPRPDEDDTPTPG